MPIVIPESTDQRFVFPYVDLSKSFRYAHYKPEVTKFRLTMKSLDSFFVSLHKVTAHELTQISRFQKMMGCALLPLAVFLIIFGVLLGINYDGTTDAFITRFSLGIIFSACGVFFVFLIYSLIRVFLLKRTVKTRILSLINETRTSFARARVKWVFPKLDFPYWLELYIDQGAGLPDHMLGIPSPATAIPSPSASAFLVNRNMPNEHDLVDTSKFIPSASPRANANLNRNFPNEQDLGDASKLVEAASPRAIGGINENVTAENVELVVS